MKNIEKTNKKTNNHLKGFYISAFKRNSGKTTISVALSRLLRDKGFLVQPFKKGPDFIDPMWLSRASGRACYNLDFYFMPSSKIKKHFNTRSLNSDISVVEGNHGLHDSFEVRGLTSNASMAKLLGLPVILVVDVNELNRGVIPLLLGFQDFDRDVKIKGVILNKVHSKRHEKNLNKAINYYTNFKVVGNIPKDNGISIKQRHLGLFSTMSEGDIENRIFDIALKVKDSIDLDSIIKIAGIRKMPEISGDSLPAYAPFFQEVSKEIKSRKGKNGIKIGLAYDNAFNFYYNENIEALEALGCEIVRFSPLRDEKLPGVDAAYIGGGFPEILCRELEANINFRKDLAGKIENGLPVYAECGGLMYLCKGMSFNDESCDMVGAIDAHVKLTKKPKGHGYTKLSPVNYGKNGSKWFDKIKFIKGHEFHHSYLETVEENLNLSFDVIKGYGVNGFKDGISRKNLYASYTHMYSPSSPGWFRNWVSFIKALKP